MADADSPVPARRSPFGSEKRSLYHEWCTDMGYPKVERLEEMWLRLDALQQQIDSLARSLKLILEKFDAGR